MSDPSAIPKSALRNSSLHPLLKRPAETLEVSLFCDDPLLEVAVRLSLPSHAILAISLDALADENGFAEPRLEEALARIERADVALVQWKLQHAPLINMLCFHLRHRSIPAFALCGGSQVDQIEALASATDDVMTLPIHEPLLKARLTAYHRLVRSPRLQESGAEAAGTETPGAPPREQLRYGPLTLDLTAHQFYVHDAPVTLTPREFALLEYLMRNPGIACSRDRILEEVWGLDFETGTNMVDVYMYYLRTKLEAHGVRDMIQTVRRLGYRLALPRTAA